MDPTVDLSAQFTPMCTCGDYISPAETMLTLVIGALVVLAAHATWSSCVERAREPRGLDAMVAALRVPILTTPSSTNPPPRSLASALEPNDMPLATLATALLAVRLLVDLLGQLP